MLNSGLMIEIIIHRQEIGFGFTVCGENPPVVDSIAPGSPADLAGLQKNDILISINGLSVKHAPHEVVINFMRSKSNVAVVVTRDLEGSQCKYCQYPTITRVSNATHPQPTMLTTLLYIGSHDLHAHSVDLDSIYSTIELLKQYDTNVETIVTMEVNSRGISVANAADKTLAFYNILSLRYCGMWPKDKRYFGLITEKNRKHTCHVFMTDLTSTERFLAHFGHAGLTIKSANGTIGHKHKVRVATHIVRGFASVYRHRDDVQVDQTKTNSDNMDTESVFYDNTDMDTARGTRQSVLSLNSIQYDSIAQFAENVNPQQTPLNNQFSQVVGETSRIAEWAKGFDKLLEDPDGVAYFQDFLKKEYADENIKFWLACRKYEGMSDQKKRQEEAAFIISEYLVSGAPNPINIDASGREEVVKSCHLAHHHLFKPMQKQIYNLMMYGKYWQFTRSDDYLNLLEQEKLGKSPIFKHITSPKDGKRKNAINENAHNSRNRKFFSFFGIRKREETEVIQSNKHNNHINNNNNSNNNNNKTHHHNNNHHNNNHHHHHPVTKHQVLLEMPNCTLRRAYYNGQESVKSCVERALVNTGVNLNCYHICMKKTGEVIDIQRPVNQFSNMTLSFLNTPTFQISMSNNKKFKFCTSHGKTLKDICKSVLSENSIDLRSIILFERDSRSYVRLDTQSILVANKNLEVRDISQRSTSVPRLGMRKVPSKSNVRRSVTVGCSGSLESNLDLLSSVMESSDDDATDFNANGGQLVRSQSELEFFELLNRVQCDRLDNQRCSHPTVLKNLSLGRRNDSVKTSKKGFPSRKTSKTDSPSPSNVTPPPSCPEQVSPQNPDIRSPSEPSLSTKHSVSSHSPGRGDSEEDIDYC
ncbi:regulator of G-protein signaling 12-like isoform X2 [Bolinopsis microptera]|uniref:regulator of G-protein signaling 12-like isoform X2 n=1 Tax=Bolinopsis microptera TaxID=2820187 RepID=UPI0030790D94